MNEPPSSPVTEVPLPHPRDDEHRPVPIQHTRYVRLLRMFWLLGWGVVFPVLVLPAGGGFVEGATWQSGDSSTYCLLAFQPTAMGWLYPLLAFSACGLIAQILRNADDPPPAWVLFAVFFGLVLWVELWVVWCGAVSEGMWYRGLALTFVAAPIVGVLVTHLPISVTALGMSTAEDEAAGGIVAAAVLLMSLVLCGVLVAAMGPFVLYLLVCTVPLALSAYVWASIALFRSLPQRRRISIASLLVIFTWLSANFAAWRMAALSAVDEYSRLPTEMPESCFVVTAAGRGHRRWVGSRDLGQRFAVTYQLQQLKALELLLRATSPGLHRWLRHHYNRIGPRIARQVRTAWLADGVYLLLKPAEWIAWLAVRVVARVPREVVSRVYRVDR